MIADAEAYMVESDNQRLVKRVLREIAAIPTGLSHSNLLRALKHSWRAPLVAEAVKSLKDAGQILEASKQTPGRPSKVYIAVGGDV